MKLIKKYLHMCCKLCTLLNLDTGYSSWTLTGPNTGLKFKKNRYRPLREVSTAFSMNSTIVCALNIVQPPKQKLPDEKKTHIETKLLQRIYILITCMIYGFRSFISKNEVPLTLIMFNSYMPKTI